MSSRRAPPGVFATLLLSAAAAAAPPAPINDLTDKANLGPAEKAQIKAYVDYWCVQLEGEDPVEVSRARTELLKPLRAIKVLTPFRFAMTDASLEHLEKIIAGDGNQSTQSAINAMQVVGALGTVKALDSILAHCDSDREKRFPVRLWAAKSFGLTVPLLNQNDINRGVRELGRAATHEEESLALRRQFEAISSVRNDISRDEQVKVLNATADRMARAEGPSPLMEATYRAVQLMMTQFADLDVQQQQQVGTVLAPVLGEVQEVAEKHWDQAQNDQHARDVYGDAVRVSEQLLSYIDTVTRPKGPTPKSQLDLSWQQRDKPRFRQDRGAWESVLKQPPYRPP